jgi:hypothetical protein
MDDYKLNGIAVLQIFFKVQDFFRYVQSQIDSGKVDNVTVRVSRREPFDYNPVVQVDVDITQAFRVWQITKSN